MSSYWNLLLVTFLFPEHLYFQLTLIPLKLKKFWLNVFLMVVLNTLWCGKDTIYGMLHGSLLPTLPIASFWLISLIILQSAPAVKKVDSMVLFWCLWNIICCITASILIFDFWKVCFATYALGIAWDQPLDPTQPSFEGTPGGGAYVASCARRDQGGPSSLIAWKETGYLPALRQLVFGYQDKAPPLCTLYFCVLVCM